MLRGTKGALWLCCLVACTGCSVVAAPEVCERRASATRDLNADTRGDQIVAGQGSLFAFREGTMLGVFVTPSATDPELALSMRLVRMDGTGQRLTGCDGELDYTLFSARDAQIGDATLAGPGPTTDATALLWAVTEDGAPDEVRLTLLDGRDGCPQRRTETEVLSAEPPGARVLSVSLSHLGAQRYLAVWNTRDDEPRSIQHARAFFVPPSGPLQMRALRDPAGGAPVEDRPIDFDLAPGSLVTSIAAVSMGEHGIAIAAYALSALTWQVHLMLVSETFEMLVPPFALGPPFADALLSSGASVRMAWDGEQLMVVWVEQDAVEGQSRVVARFVAPDGSLLRDGSGTGESPLRVTTQREGTEVTPAVVARPEGGFHVAYAQALPDVPADSSRRIALASFDREGERQFLNPACERAEIDVGERPGRAQRPALAITAEGGLAVLWSAEGDANADAFGLGVLGRVFERRALLPVP